MSRKWISISLCIMVIFCFPFKTSASSGAFLVMDGRNGMVLESENADTTLPMASTTKVMTAIVVLENADLGDEVKIPQEAAGIEGSSLYMKSGETYTVEQLLYGLMLRSANDCAQALAWYVGDGDSGKFIDMMNEEAKSLGLNNTSFANPSGLPAENHYTTARELALLMKTAMKNENFREIVGTKKYTIGENVIANHNKLLSLCEGCIGGKTGYTMEAGRCLVTYTERDEVPLICVTLNRRDDWNIHCDAYEKWFETLQIETLQEIGAFSTEIKVAGGESVTVRNADPIRVSLFEGEDSLTQEILAPSFLYGNKEAGAVVGTLVYRLNGEIAAESPLVLQQEIQVPVEKDLFISRIFRFFRRLFLKNKE